MIYIFLKTVTKNFLSDFSVNFLGMFSIFFLCFMCLFAAKFSVHLFNINHDEILIKIGKMNLWFILSISIILTSVIFSFSFYDSFTNYPFPIQGKITPSSDLSREILNNSTKSGIYIDCDNGVKNEREYIQGKTVYCNFLIEYKSGNFSSLKKIEVLYFLDNKTNFRKFQNYSLNDIENNETRTQVPVEIIEDFNQAIIYVYFENNEKQIQIGRVYLKPEKILTQEQYEQKRSDSLTLLVALLSIFVLSSVIAINNLRQMFQNK